LNGIGAAKMVRGLQMMLISVGAMLLAWVAFIWFMDPDGVGSPKPIRCTSHNRRDARYY
jgi:hypothetical protein